ncbi:RNA polymerase sigma factor [Mucilaginibacter sp. UR6-11]|uniref:RNA polymerase sigma factor n=1 Tax=Mucilaginibacter sp. UR6-11 TaxID=1435644 RepID=UPI001E33487B|nr:sigma-70 family RNA polymerase sigma factor [Mucilaginibacter sp. UR6-11]MCC8424630.1 sigma-70 family RNA polymerase sigma factor [Mucilaginibacter sp. UR6-11]
MDHTEDGYYIEKVKNGNPDSFAFLVDKYKDMVYSISIKILRDQDNARDLAQECFVKAYQQIHKFEGKSKFSTWLYTIAYRTAVTKLKENRVETITMSDYTDEIADHLPGQFEQLQAKQVKQYVQAAIQKLPQTDALLVTLYYINDLPVKEIEEITGLSKPNVKIKLFRARKVLERDLKFLLDSEMKVIDES